MTDFHSHILPKIDDGSDSIETSIEMLKMSKAQGVETIIATPHFYADRQNPDKFIKNRDSAVDVLENEMNKNEGLLPKIEVGAEVAYFEGISDCDFLDDFKIQNTSVILIEMPMCKWNDRVISEVGQIYQKNGLIPLIAHIDRYMKIMKDYKLINKFNNMPVLIQANASFFTDKWTKRKAMKMLSNGQIHLLGSDCHNLTSRKPNLGEAIESINKHIGDEPIKRIDEISYYIVNNKLESLEAVL